MKHIWLTLLFCAGGLTMMAADPALQNPSFETADKEDPSRALGWGPFSESGEPPAIVLTPEDAKDGVRSLRLAFDGKKDGFLGVVQDIAVTPGDKLKFSGSFKKVDLKQGSYIKLGLEWKNADGTEISREQNGEINTQTLSTSDWREFEVTAVAPPKTAKAVLTVTFYTEKATSGAILLDDMSLEKLAN
jgi:hypothetical protein